MACNNAHTLPINGALVTESTDKYQSLLTHFYPHQDATQATVAKEHFNDLLWRGIIRPSNSCWASPLHMVPKQQTAQWPPCGDYRALNRCTTPDRYPLPHLAGFAHNLHAHAYYQILMRPQDIAKTAITTPFGLFEFLKMLFGLRNAAQSFQRFTDTVTRGIEDCFVYVDDILLAREQGQIHSGRPSLHFLGHTVDANGIRPLPDKVQAVKAFPAPKTGRELRRFLGMVNFYRRFLPHITTTLAPLDAIASAAASMKITLTHDQLQAFSAAKDALTNATMLHHPQPTADYALMVDASDHAIGAVLQQPAKNSWRQLAFFSKRLTATQKELTTLKASVSSVKAVADKEDLQPAVEVTEAAVATVMTRNEVAEELAEVVRQLKELLMTDIPVAAKRAPSQQRRRRKKKDRRACWTCGRHISRDCQASPCDERTSKIETPIVEGSVGSVRCNMLVDTGSAVTLADEKFMRGLKTLWDVPKPAIPLRGHSVWEVPCCCLVRAESPRLDRTAHSRAILREFADVLSMSDEDLGQTSVIRYTIHTGDAKPVMGSPTRIAHYQRTQVESLLNKMLRRDVVELSSSPCASLIVLVKKEDGSCRFCVDYRLLNNVTRKDAHPLPRIDDTLHALAFTQWFSTLGLGKRLLAGGGGERGPTEDGLLHPLWPVPVQSDAFWTVQRAGHLSETQGDGPESPGRVQVPGTPRRRHRTQQFCRRAYGPTARGASSQGCGPECEDREMPAHEEEGGILGPYHIRERHFHGPKQNFHHAGVADTDLCNGVAAVPGAGVVLPQVRQRLCEHRRPYAFEALKNHLTSARILTYPDFHGKTERVVAYASRTLTKAERWYIARLRKKCSACCLHWLRNFKEPEGQVAWWLESLAELDFKVEHRAGRLHGNAAALSRASCSQEQLLAAQQAHPEIRLLRQWLFGPSWLVDCPPPECSRDMHVLWQQRLSWLEEDSLIWQFRHGLTAEDGLNRYAGQLVEHQTLARVMCDEERPDEEQPCAIAGHHRGIPPAAIRRGRPGTAGNVLVLESVRPGPDGWLHQVDGRIPPHQHLSWYRGQDVGREVHREDTILSYHPQGNGQAESFNRTLLDMLSIMVRENPHQWDLMLPFVMLAYNSSVHESTGVTPAIAMFGRELGLPLDVQIENPPEQETQGLPEYIRKTRERIDRVYELVMDHLKTQQRLQKCLYDRHANETHFSKNDRV
ncbi:Retrovirus-related Pol polyprotein from transposon opus [Trichinella spiralis]|uniref:RNA-directed DNA polymerase n=1 Tax=Trichinella spiralis TaxID=6334 RepID=A0A0V1C0V6_TRISP|nr:Retrovirus-related Pol polyprotein from transposon opus [Trichinella spiralis]